MCRNIFLLKISNSVTQLFVLDISPGHWMSLTHLLQVQRPHPPHTILRKILSLTTYELAVPCWQTEKLLTSWTAALSASYGLRLNYSSRSVTVTRLWRFVGLFAPPFSLESKQVALLTQPSHAWAEKKILCQKTNIVRQPVPEQRSIRLTLVDRRQPDSSPQNSMCNVKKHLSNFVKDS